MWGFYIQITFPHSRPHSSGWHLSFQFLFKYPVWDYKINEWFNYSLVQGKEGAGGATKGPDGKEGDPLDLDHDGIVSSDELLVAAWSKPEASWSYISNLFSAAITVKGLKDNMERRDMLELPVAPPIAVTQPVQLC
jgi:hypothetical protein